MTRMITTQKSRSLFFLFWCLISFIVIIDGYFHVVQRVSAQNGISILEIRCKFEGKPISQKFLSGLCYAGYDCVGYKLREVWRSSSIDELTFDFTPFGVVILNDVSCIDLPHRGLVNFYKEGGFIISTVRPGSDHGILINSINQIAKDIELGDIYRNKIIHLKEASRCPKHNITNSFITQDILMRQRQPVSASLRMSDFTELNMVHPTGVLVIPLTSFNDPEFPEVFPPISRSSSAIFGHWFAIGDSSMLTECNHGRYVDHLNDYYEDDRSYNRDDDVVVMVHDDGEDDCNDLLENCQRDIYRGSSSSSSHNEATSANELIYLGYRIGIYARSILCDYQQSVCKEFLKDEVGGFLSLKEKESQRITEEKREEREVNSTLDFIFRGSVVIFFLFLLIGLLAQNDHHHDESKEKQH